MTIHYEVEYYSRYAGWVTPTKEDGMTIPIFVHLTDANREIKRRMAEYGTSKIDYRIVQVETPTAEPIRIVIDSAPCQTCGRY